MTPEAQRIAIAKACGWVAQPDGPKTAKRKWSPPGKSESPYSDDLMYLPDYLNDLNAMHEAEKVLTDEQQHWFVARLYQILTGSLWLRDRDNTIGSKHFFKLIHATAAQRAEAFLRTLNLWKE